MMWGGVLVRVTIKLFATLRTGRFKADTREYAPGTTVLQVAGDLNIPREDLALILLNGQTASLEQSLGDEDILALFPPVGGG